VYCIYVLQCSQVLSLTSTAPHCCHCSMNQGDYSQPLYMPEDQFGSCSAPQPRERTRAASSAAASRDEFRQFDMCASPSTAATAATTTTAAAAATATAKGTKADSTNNLFEQHNLFEQLHNSVTFEKVGKGRLGAVLVQLDGDQRVPIVRTTARYTTAAQCFQPLHEDLALQIQRMVVGPVAGPVGGMQTGFNNALVETYTNAYAKMGYHSDQDLDLKDGTYTIHTQYIIHYTHTVRHTLYTHSTPYPIHTQYIIHYTHTVHHTLYTLYSYTAIVGAGTAITLFSCYRSPEIASRFPRKLLVESKEPGGHRFELILQHNSVVIWSVEANRRYRHKVSGPRVQPVQTVF
jgi:hypothetical protein